MVVVLGVILVGFIVFARRPLWAGGALSKALYIATVVSAAGLILLLVIERIEAMGEYQ